MKRIFLNFFLFTMASLLILQFALLPALGHFFAARQRQEMTTYNRDLSRGLFFVLISELNTMESTRWAGHIRDLQQHFGFPINLRRLDSTTFNPDEKKDLQNGLIAVHDEDGPFSQRIGDSAFVLELGPFAEMAALYSMETKILVWASILVFLMVLSLVWAFPFWRSLNIIQTAARAFGRGDFSRRAPLPPHSALSPLAESFNDMASRIQQLIISHRELTRAVSHELRTPLTRIRFSLEMLAFNLEMLADSGVDAKRRRLVTNIETDVDEMEDMISELLSYARFEAQGTHLDRQHLPLLPWLAETAAGVENELQHLQFSLHCPQGIEKTVASFEPRDMGRAVTNLLRNAVRYARHRVELRVEHADGQTVLHVDDDGPGIPDGDAERIFEPFTRLDESRSRHSGGVGLGLAIVSSVARCHGGEASVSTSPLGGARFTLQWPDLPEASVVAHQDPQPP